MSPLLAATSLVAACSSSDDEPDDTTANESNGDVEVDGDGGSDVDDGPTDAGGPTSDDVGSGSVRIDGVEFGGFEGDCQINRNSGREVVGDLSTSGLTVVVGVDNIDSQPAEELNFVMINEGELRSTERARRHREHLRVRLAHLVGVGRLRHRGVRGNAR